MPGNTLIGEENHDEIDDCGSRRHDGVRHPGVRQHDDSRFGYDRSGCCTLTGPANNNAVNLTTSTGLGNVTVKCNDAAGFTATVSSANSGLLKDASGHSPTTFGYTAERRWHVDRAATPSYTFNAERCRHRGSALSTAFQCPFR